MSGFAGVVHTDGRPVDPAVFDRLLPILQGRGPDADGTWMDHSISIGYSTLNIEDHRPCSGPFLSSEQLVFVGDIRLDARAELMKGLSCFDPKNPARLSDAELILHAYRRWGECCLEHLKGDFSFAIWDRKEKKLFCARDHFGIRPFYYGVFDETVVFSNTLKCLLVFKKLADRLDESIIGEYLLSGQIGRLDRTPFSAIRRLAPAHLMRWSNGKGIHFRQYWTPTLRHRSRRYKGEEVLRQFEDRMSRAVSDRLPRSSALVLMSGGLDSTCVAAFAKEMIAASQSSCALSACTFVYDRLIHDREREFAQKAAEALSVPIHLIGCDDDGWQWFPTVLSGFCPEPVSAPPTSVSLQQALALLKESRVGLSGQGGDPALPPRPRHAGILIKSLLFGGLTKDLLLYRYRTGNFPKLGLQSSIQGWLGRLNRPYPVMPPWIAPDFSNRCDLAGLLKELNRFPDPAPCLRSEAHRFVFAPFWASAFEHCDAGATGIPAQIRHPFFDLRVMTFLLSLPPIPWCVDKAILRKTLKGRLPEEIVKRRKTPLSENPIYAAFQKSPQPMRIKAFLKDAGLSRFVDFRLYLKILRNSDKLRSEEIELVTRPLGLAWWLLQDKPQSVL